jgi:hypothetical protein
MPTFAVLAPEAATATLAEGYTVLPVAQGVALPPTAFDPCHIEFSYEGRPEFSTYAEANADVREAHQILWNRSCNVQRQHLKNKDLPLWVGAELSELAAVHQDIDDREYLLRQLVGSEKTSLVQQCQASVLEAQEHARIVRYRIIGQALGGLPMSEEKIAHVSQYLTWRAQQQRPGFTQVLQGVMPALVEAVQPVAQTAAAILGVLMFVGSSALRFAIDMEL